MNINYLHNWDVGVPEAMQIQRSLAGQVSLLGEIAAPRLVAGVDLAVDNKTKMAVSSVVVLKYPELQLVETRTARGKLSFPYVPGLLSFREMPLVLAACEKLALIPDLFLADGQGLAHPRRIGLASHLGLFLDKPTIGCAKSRLCGDNTVPDNEAGSYTLLTDKGDVIGATVRTKTGIKPLYVSVGHKVSLDSSIEWVLKCCRGYRLPEPTRSAHLVANEGLRLAAV